MITQDSVELVQLELVLLLHICKVKEYSHTEIVIEYVLNICIKATKNSTQYGPRVLILY